MAVVWSWAFGAETFTDLSTNMEFTFPTTGATQAPQTGAANVYSYPAYPGTKHSWGSSAFRKLEFPATAAWNTIGTIAAPILCQGAWRQSTTDPLLSAVMGSGRRIWMSCSNSAASVISCFVDNVLAGTVTLTVNDWHYVAITYDVSTVNWTATFFVDGAAVATGASVEVVETSGFYRTGGFSNTALALTAQLIVYDSGTPAATAAAPIFCTRLPPNADDAVQIVGVWVPSAGVDNFAVTNDNPFTTATFTQDAAPASGDTMVTEVDNLIVQLGLTAGSVLGATNHTYSIGTAVQVFASCRPTTSAYTDGDTITPDAGDTTYAWATTSDGTLAGTSTLQCKFEVV
jgi:hypothetical protein